MFCPVCQKDIGMTARCPHGAGGPPGETTVRATKVSCPSCHQLLVAKSGNGPTTCPWCGKEVPKETRA